MKEAMQKKYYKFTIEQLRHLLSWINSNEESISKPVHYQQNEIMLEELVSGK